MKESKEKGFAMKRKDGLIYLCFREVAFVLIEFLMMKREKNGQTQSAPCLASSFFLRLFDCFPVPANFRIPCSIFFFRRMKSCKKDVSFRRQQSRAGRCQSPDLTSSFFLRLFPCSSVLTSRVKTKIFTLIELLIMNTCQIYIYSEVISK